MTEIQLPEPSAPKADFGKLMLQRKSRRSYRDKPLTLEQLSFLLWSAGGPLEGRPGRKVPPSAGACYPLDVYVSIRTGGIEGIEPGVYFYQPGSNSLKTHIQGEMKEKIANSALGQKMLTEAPAVIILTAEFERSTVRYGERGIRYTYMDAGHAGQNIYLSAEACGLGTCAIGAFHDDEMTETLELPEGRVPLYFFPIGTPSE